MDFALFPHHIAELASIEASDDDLTAKLASHVADYSPVVVRGGVAADTLARRLAAVEGASDQAEVLTPLVDDTPLSFTLLGASQGGDMGLGEDLRPNFRSDDRTTSARDFMRYAARLATNRTGECAYAASIPIQRFPALGQLIDPREEIGGRPLWHRQLWAGSGGHTVDLHHDRLLNFIAQYAGRKRVTLFPPDALPHLYPAPLHRTVGGVPRSLVKVLRVDAERYPRFESALESARVVTLEPGDELYIPPLWWHHVESAGFNLMVNSWYLDTAANTEDQLTAAEFALRRGIARTHSLKVTDELATRVGAALENGHAHETLPTPLPPKILAALDELTNATAALPAHWQRWYALQARYYILKEFGDPYPTLPGALREVARHIRFARPIGWLRAIVAFPGRVLRFLRRRLGSA
ncbi:MAG: cupin-like domain-containing protein [Pseudomonadota bacterium]